MSRNGFTLLELLVVVAVSSFLSVLAITFSHTGQNSVTLTIEESKIAQFILQAKQLSIATYGAGGGSDCGYGLKIDTIAQTYSIFAYSPAGAVSCPPIGTVTANLTAGISPSDETQYTTGTWAVKVSQGVKLVSHADSLSAILFYPPDPTVFLSHDGTTFPLPATTEKIYLVTADGQNSGTLSVNPEGQVSF